ncbi:MAG: NAD(P)H-dependent oxidoreductase [Deltaproteobacteria bacterium]|nr:NAD(P)H-dependent oxidoreductase [Deltaproteobacteria bacterium]
MVFIFQALSANARAQKASKILVAYFSWSGNAKAMAEQIAGETGGQLFEIKTVQAYPDAYDECLDVAKKEKKDKARPALASIVPNMADYDIVFLCYPNWWGTFPMGVFTFLETHDLSGKTVYPLVTHGGSRFGSSLNDIKKVSPKIELGEAIHVSAFDRDPKKPPTVSIPNSSVADWLAKLGYKR